MKSQLLKRFAFSLPKNGPFNQVIIHEIKKMTENGELNRIRKKYTTKGKITEQGTKKDSR